MQPRPSLNRVPAKRLHWAAFVASALFALIGLAIFGLAQHDGLDLRSGLIVAATGLLPSVIALIVGLFLRRRYLRRRQEREDYLHMVDRAANSM